MNVDWSAINWAAVGSIAGAVGAVVAVIALFVAGGANARAKDANDLQKRIDDRSREFRDVRWRAGMQLSDDGSHTVFTLANHGLTDAQNVVVVIEYSDRPREHYKLGTIEAGQWKPVESEGLQGWRAATAEAMPIHPAFTVHWWSPLGTADEYTSWEGTIFQTDDSQ